MKDRKILVEVTPEEYEKIVAGNLDKDLASISTEALINEIVKRSNNVQSIKSDIYDPMAMHYAIVLTGRVDVVNDTNGLKERKVFEWVCKSL